MKMMNNNIKILAVDDEQTMLRILKRTLQREGYSIETFADPKAAIRRLQTGDIDIVVTDLMMEEIDGFEILQKAMEINNEITVIVITAFSSVESAVKAMQLGAYDFIPKPFDPEHLLLIIQRAIAARRLKQENIGLRRELCERDHLRRIIGISKPIQEVKRLINKVKDTDGTVLITGESGVGKELVAKAIHEGSRRKEEKFIPINCGALPDDLLESELFGYEKGAFSGAINQKKGLLEVADKGTLFLDEVGSISQMMQVKLLRFLQDKSFMRLGGQEMIQVDVRVIAATNENLIEKIKNDRFRKDLFYRLNVIAINVPPLRQRCDDIKLLIRFFIEKYTGKTGKQITEVEKRAENLMLAAPWPGNVRELENCIERAITLTDGEKITATDLPPEITNAHNQINDDPGCTLNSSLAEVEKKHIIAVMNECNGNKSKAARILDIDYSTLLRKLKNLRL
jgi:DNA-binding NtrC family response regulator